MFDPVPSTLLASYAVGEKKNVRQSLFSIARTYNSSVVKAIFERLTKYNNAQY